MLTYSSRSTTWVLNTATPGSGLGPRQMTEGFSLSGRQHSCNVINQSAQNAHSQLQCCLASKLLALTGVATIYLGLAQPARSFDSACATNSVAATAIQTTRDVEAFVNCAFEYVQENGFEEARRAFHEDPRWRDDLYYVFVDGLAESAQDSLVFVYPPEPSFEGSTWGSAVGDLVDGFGTDVIAHDKQVLDIVDRGWTYARFRNPSTGIEEPKVSYVIRLEWEGHDAFIGAGIYLRDRPGTCRPEHVNAAALEADPNDATLREFVRCAAMQVESLGFFAGPTLSQDDRWRTDSIYVFAINTLSQQVEFSGSKISTAASEGVHERFDGRDVVGIGEAFGEAFWYYDFTNPATGRVERKRSFVKRVVAQRVPLLVGAGYYSSDPQP